MTTTTTTEETQETSQSTILINYLSEKKVEELMR